MRRKNHLSKLQRKLANHFVPKIKAIQITLFVALVMSTTSTMEMTAYSGRQAHIGTGKICSNNVAETSMHTVILRRRAGTTNFPHIKFNLGAAIGSYVQDGQGVPQYKLYEATGSNCLETDPGDDLPFTITFVAGSIGAPAQCKISHILVSQERLKPCSDPTTAHDMYHLFEFGFRDPALTLDSDLSSLGITLGSGYHGLRLGGQFNSYNFKNFVIPTHFDDVLVELLVTRGTLKPFDFEITRFSPTLFSEMKKAYKDRALRYQFTAEKFFKKQTHNSLTGFYLTALSKPNADLDGPTRWRVLKDITHIDLSHSFLFQGYISDPNSIGVGHELDLYFEIKGKNNVHKEFLYKMKISKNVANQGLSVDLYDELTGTHRASLDTKISINEEHTPRYWLHFALCIGIGARYYKKPSAGPGIDANFKIYETMVFSYHRNKYEKVSSYNVDGHIEQMIPNYFENGREEDRFVYHGVWYDLNSVALTPSPGIDPEVRMFRYTHSRGAFPAPFRPHLVKTLGPDSKSRCFLRTVISHRCFAFAFLFNMEDTSGDYLKGASIRTCFLDLIIHSPRKCLYCADMYNCLIPIPGKNRELSFSEQDEYPVPVQTVDEIANSAEAPYYVDFRDNLGVDYKIRCPFACKSFFRNFIDISVGKSCSIENDMECDSCHQDSLMIDLSNNGEAYKSCLCNENTDCKILLLFFNSLKGLACDNRNVCLYCGVDMYRKHTSNGKVSCVPLSGCNGLKKEKVFIDCYDPDVYCSLSVPGCKSNLQSVVGILSY